MREPGDRAGRGHARLAAELGYFDQAHFVQDFRAATGRLPSALRAPSRVLSAAAIAYLMGHASSSRSVKRPRRRSCSFSSGWCIFPAFVTGLIAFALYQTFTEHRANVENRRYPRA